MFLMSRFSSIRRCVIGGLTLHLFFLIILLICTDAATIGNGWLCLEACYQGRPVGCWRKTLFTHRNGGTRVGRFPRTIENALALTRSDYAIPPQPGSNIMDDFRFFPVIITILEDDNVEMRIIAIRYIARMHPLIAKQAIPQLERCLSDHRKSPAREVLSISELADKAIAIIDKK